MGFRGTLVAGALALSLVGCGGGGDRDETGDGAEERDSVSASWRTSEKPVSTDGLIWSAGSRIHLADGTVLETDTSRVDGFVVAGDGAFYADSARASEKAHGGPTSGYESLKFIEPGQKPVDTALLIMGRSLSASPDGRYLAVLDVDTDAADLSGEPLRIRVFDLHTGEEPVFTSDGMVDERYDSDLADYYEDSEPGIRGISDEHVWVDGAEDMRIELATGDTDTFEYDDVPEAPDLQVSPDGRWRIDSSEASPERLPVVESEDGTRLVPRLRGGEVIAYFWVSDRQFVGVAERDAGDSLATCEVPSGDCSVVEGTAGATVSFPNWGPDGFVFDEEG